MRPRETSPRADLARPNLVVNMPCPPFDTLSLLRTRCAGQYLATIDPCHGYNFGPDGGGHTPLGVTYAGRTPYGLAFDHGSTVLRGPKGERLPTRVLTPGNGGTWNWDDAGWFTAALDDACQADWYRYQLRQVRSFTNARSFLVLPGRLINSFAEGVPNYRLAAHPEVATALEATWATTLPTLTFRPDAKGLRAGRSAGPGPRCRQRLPRWQLRVNAPDVTSIYSWHLQRPDGSWAALTMGDSITLYPAAAGRYRLYLRQDDKGLAPYLGDSRMWAVADLPPAEAQCVGRRGLLGRRYPTAPELPRAAALAEILKPAEAAVLQASRTATDLL